jgi:hypothetical protein
MTAVPAFQRLNPGLRPISTGRRTAGISSQTTSDAASLLSPVERVWQSCRARPLEVSPDSGFFSVWNLRDLEQREIEGFLPDAHLNGEF